MNDIARVLEHAQSIDFDGINFIVMRQPKERGDNRPDLGTDRLSRGDRRESRPRHLEALNPSKPMRWSKSLTPDRQPELEWLREEDGHEIITTRHDHKINVSLESIRATQLYRALLHEIGHSMDNDRDPNAFDGKSSLEKETFAHQYAKKMRERLVRFGIIPFDRIFDMEVMAREGLSVSDFTAD